MNEPVEAKRRRPGVARLILTAAAGGIALGFLVTLIYIALR